MLSKFVFSTAVVGTTLIFPTLSIQAQIIPDQSLGTESSVVVPNVNINNINSDRIDGGAIRGSNLFHSFQEFNIDNGRGAYFSNPGNISNILTRVTGSNLSNIFGTLGVLGNANLFLINPNGIVFGPNARLDVGGSFFASTADSILFENSVEFAASNPDAPPLLTINIPIGLNFRENPGSLINQAALTTTEDGNLLRDNNGFLIRSGLNVPQNQTLALIGGNVLFDNGVAISPGSNIELGGLSESGIVELNTVGANGNTPILQFPSNIQRANIALTNESQINVRADNGGDININAGHFEMSGGSIIRAGIDEFKGYPEAQGGDVNINAQDTVSIVEESLVSNVINTDAIGQPGEVNVTANSVFMSGLSFIGTQSFGQGDAGNINIATNSLLMTNNSGLSAPAFAQGNAGSITIVTGQLQLLESSQIVTGNSGQGNGGSVTIQALESVQFINGGILSGITENTIGNAGNIVIETPQLRMTDGTLIIAGNFGQGDGGNITIIASESVEMSGTGTTADGESSSNLFASVDKNAVGNAGNITIVTPQLRMTDEAQVNAANSGQGDAGNVTIRASDSVQLISGDIFSNVTENTTGNAGNITIETPQLQITDGAQVNASTEGEGSGGIITVQAENIDVSGTIFSADGGSIRSGFLAQSGASGNAGTVIIEAQQLRLTDGAVVSVSANNTGDAGTIIVRANDVELLNGLDSQNSSILDASVKPVRREDNGSGTGSGGSVTVEAERLVLRNGGRIEARTANGTGQSGQITITASESVELSGISPDNNLGGSIFTNTTGSADAGNITIVTGSFSIRDRSGISAASGLIFESMSENTITQTPTGNGGNIQIFATDSVELIALDSVEGSANITSGTFGAGNAGNITVETGRLLLENQRSLISAFTSGQGDAGNINIDVQQLQLINGSGIQADTDMSGNGGEISINATEFVELNGKNNNLSSINASTRGSGDAGNVTITTNQLRVIDGGSIFVLTLDENGGNAGEILINATDSVELKGDLAGLSATTDGSGDAGNITITTNQLRVIDGGSIFVSTLNENGGNAGEILINAGESVELRGRTTGLSARTDGSGDAGNVTITTGQLSIRDRALVSVNSNSSGIPGNIDVTAISTLVENQSLISASSEAGQGGNIRLQSNDVRLLNRSGILATGSESGQTFEGNIEIDADLLVLLNRSAILTNASSPSGGSNINIQPFNDSNIVIVQSNDSIINAAGNLSIDSSVTFQPAEIPEVAVTDPNDLIAQEFCRQRGSSDFVIRGRGGIAVSPNDKSDGNQINVDLVEPVVRRPQNTSQRRSEIDDNQPISSSTLSEVETLDIVPARGWIRDENGDVILVSYDPTKTAINRQPAQLPHCQSE